MSRTDVFNEYTKQYNIQKKLFNCVSNNLYEEIQWEYDGSKFRLLLKEDKLIENIVTTIEVKNNSLNHLYITGNYDKIFLTKGLHILPLTKTIYNNSIYIEGDPNSIIKTYYIPLMRNITESTSYVNHSIQCIENYIDKIYPMHHFIFLSQLIIETTDNEQELNSVELFCNPAFILGTCCVELNKTIKIGELEAHDNKVTFNFNKYLRSGECEYLQIKPKFNKNNNNNKLLKMTFVGFNILNETIYEKEQRNISGKKYSH
jgi:hypothetical protein